MGRFADNGYLVAWYISEVNKENTQFILHMLPDRGIIYFGLNSSVFTMRKDWCFVFKELLDLENIKLIQTWGITDKDSLLLECYVSLLHLQ